MTKLKWPLRTRMVPEYGIDIDGTFISLALLLQLKEQPPVYIKDQQVADVLYEHRLIEKGDEPSLYWCGELLPQLLDLYDTSVPALSCAEALASELSDLHIAAGAPSSRLIAESIGTVSHTTVNKAIRGHSLPTWPTLRKIVEYLHGDVPTYQKLWMAADRERWARS